MYRVNASNPFKIPTCFERAEQVRRKERFRKSVVAIVVAVVALLVILLVQGCMSEHAKTTGNTTTPLRPTVASNSQIAGTTIKPALTPSASTLAANPVATPPVAPVVNAARALPATTTPSASTSPKAELVYVIKPGDTLTRIARNHQTTVKAIKSINGLENDTIVVGNTLKLPSA